MVWSIESIKYLYEISIQMSKKVSNLKIYDYEGKKNLCGNRIKEARRTKKMSQSELAAKMQVEGIILERDSISRIEIGTRFVTDYELMIFAKILKVNVDWLLTQNKT